MSLKREIGKLEQAEQMQEEEELTEEMRQAEQRSIDEKVEGLYRRINVIVEYIDREKNEEELTREKQQREGILLQSLRASKKEITDEQMKKIIERLKENDGVTTITEQQLKQDEQHFREVGLRTAWELKAIELDQKNKDLTKLLKEEENSYNRGFEDGVNYTALKEDFVGFTLWQKVDKKEQPEESGKSQGTDRPKGEKSRVVGLGRTVGDV